MYANSVRNTSKLFFKTSKHNFPPTSNKKKKETSKRDDEFIQVGIVVSCCFAYLLAIFLNVLAESFS